MNRVKIAIICGLLVAITIVGSVVLKTGKVEALRSGGARLNASQGSCGVWSVVASPNPGPSDNALGAVAAVSPTNVWAVGEYLRSGASSITQTLTEHWDGTKWIYVPSPNVGALGNTLYGVAASSASDVWAVGFYTDKNFLSHALTEHWNGSHWSIVSSPDPGSSYDNLFGVVDFSSDNAWAVGFYRNDGDINATKTLIEHWDGKQWKVVTSPNPGSSGNLLYGISAASANDIWAVGQYFNNSPDQSLVEHWNGKQWDVVKTPTTNAASNALFAVSASSQGIWSAGRIESDITPTTSLTEQWNGSNWNIVFSPSRGPSDNNLYGVTNISSQDVWAAGNSINAAGNDLTLIEHWDGSQWTIVASPDPGVHGSNILGGIAATSSNDVWAVGGYDNGGSTLTLIEHYC